MSKGKKAKKPVNSGPLEWLYINEDCPSTRRLYDHLKDEQDITAEFWDQAGVLEISGRETGFYLEESEDKDVWWVTLSPGKQAESVSLMEKMKELCSGRFTVDE